MVRGKNLGLSSNNVSRTCFLPQALERQRIIDDPYVVDLGEKFEHFKYQSESRPSLTHFEVAH